MGRATAAALAAVLAAAVSCSSQPLADPKVPATTTPGTRPPVTASADSPAPAPAPTASPGVTRFDPAVAFRHVRVLAGRIGPRLATGPRFREAAAYVERHLTAAGYAVRREAFPVPAGDSWGVPVAAGRSFNVVAIPPGFQPRQPHLLVGAHLDTVAVAPGAEDNASGVAVLLEVARLARRAGTRLPTVFVAFGAEEPRGPGDLHHFGSKRHVAAMTRVERAALRGMVSLDRVGVGGTVPLASADGGSTAVRDDLARLARELRMPTVVEIDDASDHESFSDAGLAAARIGSTPYAGYHSPGDVPAVVQPAQLHRVGRLIWAWLRVR